jgi:hypothetical protein
MLRSLPPPALPNQARTPAGCARETLQTLDPIGDDKDGASVACPWPDDRAGRGRVTPGLQGGDGGGRLIAHRRSTAGPPHKMGKRPLP